MQIEPSLRASDADREQVAERLRHATAEGRLDADELEGRLHALFAARTYAELDALLADLPAPGRSPRRQRHRVGRWAAAIAAVTLMLGAFAVLAFARVHAAVGVAGGAQVAHPRSSGQPTILPPVADPGRALLVVAFMLGLFAVSLVCGVVLWVLMRSGGSVGGLNGPSSRVD